VLQGEELVVRVVIQGTQEQQNIKGTQALVDIQVLLDLLEVLVKKGQQDIVTLPILTP
jgi:hypothetical protein